MAAGSSGMKSLIKNEHSSDEGTRVLHFASIINRNDFIDTVIRFADRRRFRMLACTFDRMSNIASPEYDSEGVPQFVLGVNGRKDYPRAVLRLAQILRRERVDVLHAHHFNEALIGAAAITFAKRSALVLGRHYHDEVYLLTNGWKRRGLLALERRPNSRAAAIVVPSRRIEELLVERQGVPAGKVRVIPYGFDFEREDCLPATPEERLAVRGEFGLNGCFLVGNFGRHHPLKDQESLLRAFARMVTEDSEARLLMVGDGPHHRELRGLSERLGLAGSGNGRADHVIFAGWRKDAKRLMAAVDVVAHPTLHEALPQTMVEVMTRAKPLVITDVSGACDHVRDGDTGIIVPKRDPEAICRALRWVRENRDAASAMGLRAREYVLSRLDIRQVIGRYEALYQDLANAKHEHGRRITGRA